MAFSWEYMALGLFVTTPRGWGFFRRFKIRLAKKMPYPLVFLTKSPVYFLRVFLYFTKLHTVCCNWKVKCTIIMGVGGELTSN